MFFFFEREQMLQLVDFETCICECFLQFRDLGFPRLSTLFLGIDHGIEFGILIKDQLCMGFLKFPFIVICFDLFLQFEDTALSGCCGFLDLRDLGFPRLCALFLGIDHGIEFGVLIQNHLGMFFPEFLFILIGFDLFLQFEDAALSCGQRFLQSGKIFRLSTCLFLLFLQDPETFCLDLIFSFIQGDLFFQIISLVSCFGKRFLQFSDFCIFGRKVFPLGIECGIDPVVLIKNDFGMFFLDLPFSFAEFQLFLEFMRLILRFGQSLLKIRSLILCIKHIIQTCILIKDHLCMFILKIPLGLFYLNILLQFSTEILFFLNFHFHPCCLAGHGSKSEISGNCLGIGKNQEHLNSFPEIMFFQRIDHFVENTIPTGDLLGDNFRDKTEEMLRIHFLRIFCKGHQDNHIFLSPFDQIIFNHLERSSEMFQCVGTVNHIIFSGRFFCDPVFAGKIASGEFCFGVFDGTFCEIHAADLAFRESGSENIHRIPFRTAPVTNRKFPVGNFSNQPFRKMTQKDLSMKVSISRPVLGPPVIGKSVIPIFL